MLKFTQLGVKDCEAFGETAIITITSGSAAFFKDDVFVDNTLRVFYVEPYAKLDVFNCEFKNNKVYAIDGEDNGDGAVVKCKGPDSDILLEKCNVYSNKAEGFGGAISASESTVMIGHCVFSDNEAELCAGAIFAGNDTLLEISSSTFEGKSTILDLLKSCCCDCDQLFAS